ncbi:hypothetical protein PRIEUP_LOCUS11969, partial [Pristimantis euphronides]
MPHLAVPIPEEELFHSLCWDIEILSLEKPGSTTAIPLPIVGWVKDPWWQVNISTRAGAWYELKQEEGTWKPVESSMIELGDLPKGGLKISFAERKPLKEERGQHYTSSIPHIIREIHDPNWGRAEHFRNGTREQCGEMRASPIQEGEIRDDDEGISKDGGSIVSTATDSNKNPEQSRCAPYKYYSSVTTDLEGSWCMNNNITLLVSVISALLKRIQFRLPRGYYLVCGSNAYQWIPGGAGGSCTLARLETATWVWEHDEVPYLQVPLHTISKRSTKEVLKEKMERMKPSWALRLSASLPVIGSPIMGTINDFQEAHLIDALGNLFDNVTDYLFDAIGENSAYTRQLVLVTNQHAVVLDYLTASRGGMYQVVGPACCHYIDPKGLMKVTYDIEQARKLKEEFRKAYSGMDLQLPEWLSWLNPLNWFRGLGGWFSGLVHIIIQGIFLIVLIFIIIKLVLMVIQRMMGAKCNCFSGKRKPPPQIQNTRIMMAVTPYDATPNKETHCKLCDKILNADIQDCVTCG